MPDFLSVFEFAAKTVRHISREFRVAWVSGVEAAQRDALVEFEAEHECFDPQDGITVSKSQCCDRGCDCGDCFDFSYEGAPACTAPHHAPVADAAAVEDPSVGVPPTPTEADSSDRFMTDAEFTAALATQKRKWAGLAERLRAYDGPVASLPIPTITEILAEHYLESLSDRRIVGCRCGLELGSRQQHWDHQADLIAGALKARTQAAEK